MCINPSERLTADEAMMDPWLSDLNDVERKTLKEIEQVDKLLEGVTLITEEEEFQEVSC